jgi:hypothetical protein
MTPRKTAATPDTIQPDASIPNSDNASTAATEPALILDHFARLSQLNVNDRVEKKKSGGVELSNLSWANVLQELKTRFPDATFNFSGLDLATYPMWMMRTPAT